MAKPLGAVHNGVNFKKAGDVLARCVCNGRISQAQANVIAKKLIMESAEVKMTVEDTIQRACKLAGIGRQFAGV